MVPSPFASTPAFRQTSWAGWTSSHACGSETSKPSARSSPRTSAPSASRAATSARPIPPAEPVTIAVSGNKNDISGRPPRADQVESLVRLLERELGTDNRPERPAPPEGQQFVDLEPDEVGAEAHQPPEVEALDADVAADEPCRIDRLPGAAREADPDRDAERAQRLDAGGEHRAADRVEGDVDVVQLRDLVVGDGAVRAQLSRELALLLRTGGCGDRRAAERCDLNRGRPDPAGGCGDEHVRVRMDVRLPVHRDPRRQVRRQEGGALGVARAGREVED